MIFIGLYLCYSLAILFVLGLLTGKALGNILKISSPYHSLGFVNTVLLGIVSLTTIISFISLILPVDTTIHLIILSCLLVYAFLDRQYIVSVIKELLVTFKNHKAFVAIGGGWVLGGLVYASGEVTAYDTGLYHAQSVKWLNEYGVVPGLGNLHFRLAFNSSWLVFSGFFDILAFDGKSYHLINLLLFVVGTVICIKGFVNIVNNKIKISSLLSCLLILYLFISFLNVPSLSTDFPATTLVLYILILVIELIEKKESEKEDLEQGKELKLYYVLVALFSFFAITIKLSVIPIILFLPFLLFGVLKKEYRQLITISLVAGIIVLLPYVFRNLILSGYFVFPVPQPTFFSFDWRVPYEQVLLIKQDTYYWAIVPGSDFVRVPNMDFVEMFQIWVKARFIRNIRFSIFLVLTPLLFIPILLLCYKGKLKNCKNIIIIQGILLSGVLFWLISAPDPRLGAGWIISFGLFPMAVLSYYVLGVKQPDWKFFTNQYLIYVVLIIFCAWLGRVALYHVPIFEGDLNLIWTIEELPEADLETVEIYEGFNIYVPQGNNRVWDAELPNTPYVNYNLQMRGDTLEDGFRVVEE